MGYETGGKKMNMIEQRRQVAIRKNREKMNTLEKDKERKEKRNVE